MVLKEKNRLLFHKGCVQSSTTHFPFKRNQSNLSSETDIP